MDYFIQQLSYSYGIYIILSVAVLLFLIAMAVNVQQSNFGKIIAVIFIVWLLLFIYGFTLTNTDVERVSIATHNNAVITNFNKGLTAIDLPDTTYLVVPAKQVHNLKLCRVGKSVAAVYNPTYYLVLTDTTLKYNCKEIKK